MKKALCLCAALLLPVICFAETDYIALPVIEKIINGEQPLDSAKVSGDLVVGGTVAVTGDLTVDGDFAITGAVTSADAVTGDTVGIPDGAFDVVNSTQLVFIASGVTNVIDSDITSE